MMQNKVGTGLRGVDWAVAVSAAAGVLIVTHSAKPPITTRVSISDTASQGNGHSGSTGTGSFAAPAEIALSYDGRYVAFESFASNLTPSDNNGYRDVFIRDTMRGETSLVSVSTSGEQGNLRSENPALTSNGRFIVFASESDNLVPGDSNGCRDVFLRDLLLGTTERVSLGASLTQGNDQSDLPSVSDDGRFVAFTSAANNLVPGDTNDDWDIFVRDRQMGTTVRVSVDSNGQQTVRHSPSMYSDISTDGRFVAFQSDAENLVFGDTNDRNDIFVRDTLLGITERVSVGADGSEANDGSVDPCISADGRYVVFTSGASNLVAGGSNFWGDVYRKDLKSGEVLRLSISSFGEEGNEGSWSPSISANGRYIAFYSYASNLVQGDTNQADVFVRDVFLSSTSRYSVGPLGVPGNDASTYPTISGDGQYVAYTSAATNLVSGDTNSMWDVFVRGPARLQNRGQ